LDPTTTSTQFQAVSFFLKREWWSRLLGWGVTADLGRWPPAIFCSSSPLSVVAVHDALEPVLPRAALGE